MSEYRIKLLVPKVINGGVWPAGEVILIPQKLAERLIALQQAELVEESTSQRPAVARRQKKALEEEEQNHEPE
jgi:hypothetical protein